MGIVIFLSSNKVLTVHFPSFGRSWNRSRLPYGRADREMVMVGDAGESEGEPWPLGCLGVRQTRAITLRFIPSTQSQFALLLYNDRDFAVPIRFCPSYFRATKTGRGLAPAGFFATADGARYYAYQVDGPFDPAHGTGFDRDKILLDPYAKGVFFPPAFSREAAIGAGSNAGKAPLGMLPDRLAAPLLGRPRAPRHSHDLIIYEMHVRGFTRRSNSNVREEERGTFAGVVAKIPYLKELGITAVELLPIQQFEPSQGNYWGYMTLNFFSPHAQYSVVGTPDGALDELRWMVDEFHKAGIEILIDVVYNHTAEMGNDGPTYTFRGIDNSTYYASSPSDLSSYRNLSGCGNDLRTTHPAARLLVVGQPRYWADIDRRRWFPLRPRFDLRAQRGRHAQFRRVLPSSREISGDHHLAEVRLIAGAVGRPRRLI